ncbi:tripartite tricarboxylate transporter TctB family protein [Natronorubrum sp. FCH18a]|uniref:tripartite tricarboxylate transporter TctB family protein n=1 Tax=Natronorubrum sp. FCH18a TaxID=3447018 RepID=UPI003F515FD5
MEIRDRIHVSERVIDYAINLLFLLVAIYAFIESLSFTESAQIWPRNVSLFMILAGTILLFREYLPNSVQPIVKDESLFGDGDEEEIVDEVGAGKLEDGEESDAEGDANEVEDLNVGRYPIDNSVFTALSMLGYIVLGYAIGLLWATPIFIAFYCWWFQKPWYLTLGLSVTGFVVGYAFWDLLYLPIDQGVLTEQVMG